MIFPFAIWKAESGEGARQEATEGLNPDQLRNTQLVAVFPFANLAIMKSYRGTPGSGTTPTHLLPN